MKKVNIHLNHNINYQFLLGKITSLWFRISVGNNRCVCTVHRDPTKPAGRSFSSKSTS